MTEHDIDVSENEARCISDGTGLCLTHPVCELSGSALACQRNRLADLEALIGRTAVHVTGCDNLPPWEGALDAGVEAMAKRIAELEPWQEVAIQSNNAIDAYLREKKPDLPDHYGMPVDGVRMVIAELEENVRNISAVKNESIAELKAKVESLRRGKDE